MELRQIAEIPLRRKLHHLVVHVADDRRGGLPMDRYRALGREIGHLSWLDLVGAAPFARPDLAELGASFDTDLLTVCTGAAAGESVVEGARALRAGMDAEITVVLRLDGLDRTHDALHGQGSWDRVWAAFDALRGVDGLRVEIRTALQARNAGEILALAEFVYEQGPDGHVVTLSSLGHGEQAAPDPAALAALRGPLFQILDRYAQDDGRLLSRVRRNFHRLRFDTAVRTMARGRQVVPCLAGLSHAVLREDGRVSVCEILPPIGSVRRRRWSEVWEGAALRTQREYIGAGGCHCTDECAMHDSLVLRPQNIARLLAGS